MIKDIIDQIKESENKAKTIAQSLKGKTPVLVASQHLKGAAYTARNQIHEINHGHCLFFDMPELNHHLVEAFDKPAGFVGEIVWLFCLSDFYHPRNQKRYLITKKILQKLGAKTIDYSLKSKTRLGQALELVNLGGFLAFYLSILDHEDPGPEPRILYLKKKLKE